MMWCWVRTRWRVVLKTMVKLLPNRALQRLQFAADECLGRMPCQCDVHRLVIKLFSGAFLWSI